MVSEAAKKRRTEERRESERKKSTSIRFSDKERQIIIEKAQTKGMNFSKYVQHMAVHGDEGLSPAAKVKIQNVVNIAREIGEHGDPEQVKVLQKKLQKEANDIWRM